LNLFARFSQPNFRRKFTRIKIHDNQERNAGMDDKNLTMLKLCAGITGIENINRKVKKSVRLFYFWDKVPSETSSSRFILFILGLGVRNTTLEQQGSGAL